VGRPSEEKVQDFAQFEGVKTRSIAADKNGFSNPESHRQAKSVVDHGIPELVAKMDSGLAVSTAAIIRSISSRTSSGVFGAASS